MNNYQSDNNSPSQGYQNQNPNYNSGQNPNYNTGQNPNWNTGQNPAYNTGQNPNYNMGQNSGYNTGQNPNWNAGQNSAYNAGQNPNYNMGQNSGYNTGQNPNWNAGQNPGYNTGQNPNYNMGQNPGYNTGQNPNWNTGQNPNYNMGQNPGYNMGQHPNYIPPGNLNETQVTNNITCGPDGVYRWMYDFSMLKNPTILYTLWKVFGISLAAVYLFVVFVLVYNGDFEDSFPSVTGIFLIIMVVILVICGIAYLLVAASNGGKYTVLFEMDDEQVVHLQMAKQFERAKAMAWISGIAGVLTGNLTMIGQSLMAGSKNMSVSTWSDVKSIKAVRKRNVIYVNEAVQKNQVYAADEDFDFVVNYIASHCINAKINV